jgi:hypothetical protein
MDWILHPIVQYGLLAAGLGLCLHLFSTMKLEQTKRERRAKDKWRALSEALSALHTDLDRVRAEMRDLQEHTGMLVPPAPTASGLNLNKRGQVLQMHRRGQSPDQIAVSLGLPRTEVDLLLKVHQIVLKSVG